MKNLIITIALIFLSYSSDAQVWQWVRTFGSDWNDRVLSMCVDHLGNTYVSGEYGADMILGEDTLRTPGFTKYFLGKIDASGNFVWAVNIGDPSTNGTCDARLHFDPSDSTVIVHSTMLGFHLRIGECTLLNNMGVAIERSFMTKIDLEGNCIWNTDLDDMPIIQLAADGIGMLYGIMKPRNSGTFNGGSYPQGIYLSKFNAADGSLKWLLKIVNSNTHQWTSAAYTVGVQAHDNKVVIGGSTGAADSVVIGGETYDCHIRDVFVASFDTSGTLEWVKIHGGQESDYINALTIDNNGSIYTAGIFSDDAIFGDTILTTVNNQDIFFAKYGRNGNIAWVRQANVSGQANPHILISGNNGFLHCLGTFNESMNPGGHPFLAGTSLDGFMIRMDTAGGFHGGITFGNIAGTLFGEADPMDVMIVAGSFQNTPLFEGHNPSAFGMTDGFVARIDLAASVPQTRMDGSNELFIYANPSSGRCTVSIPDDFLTETRLLLRISDMEGRLVREQVITLNHGRIALDMEAEAKGIYNASLSNGKKQYFGRIVFE